MEKSSQLYRALATVPPWIHYLYYDRRNSTMNKSDASDIWFWNHLVGSIFCAGYVLCKAYRSYETLKTWQASLNYVFQTRVKPNPFGNRDLIRLRWSSPLD